MLDRDEMTENAKILMQHINNTAPPGLGCVMMFFDVTYGGPVLVTNVPRAKTKVVLKETLAAIDSLPVVEENG